MTNRILYLFCDTNLLFECKPLPQLDWPRWSAFDEVQVVITDPVLREVDHRKQGSGRVTKRARAASSMFRDMLPTGGKKVVREADPRVILRVDTTLGRSRKLAGSLNYGERDDQLVGTLHKFVSDNPNEDARLLTHDTVPIYRAEGLGLGHELIPDDWLEAPEKDERDKKISKLQAEIGRLSRGPAVDVGFLDGAGNPADRLEARMRLHDPLTDGQVDELMARLEQRYPLQTDFGPPRVARSAADGSLLALSRSLSALATDKVWQPPPDAKIEKYLESHRSWASRCRELLSRLHDLLQAREPILAFRFWAVNAGTRPAADALVTVEARGGFEVMLPPESRDAGPIVLPSPPPEPPSGKWIALTERFAGIAGGDFGILPRLTDWTDNLSTLGGDGSVVDFLRESARDPNRFFYKPDRPEEPQRCFAMSCRQWRHDADREHFVGEIHVPAGSGEVKGALALRVEAENLSKPVRQTVRVRIETENVSCYEYAEALVAQFGNS